MTKNLQKGIIKELLECEYIAQYVTIITKELLSNGVLPCVQLCVQDNPWIIKIMNVPWNS